MLASCASATEAPAPALDPLFAALARPVPTATAFVEQRRSALLDEPLLLRGTLERPQTGMLVRRVDTPYHELTVVRDGEVRLEREGQPSRRFALRRSPELVAVLASFQAVLDGDPRALDPHYRIALQADGERWQLLLAPRQARLQKKLGDLRLHGAADRLDCIVSDNGNSRLLVGPAAEAERPDFDAHCGGD